MKARRPVKSVPVERLERFRLFFDGKEPRGFNEKIEWLMVNDQMPEQVICSDKILCRSHVANRIGADCLREVFQVASSVDDIQFAALPRIFVAKTNHDSGSVYPVSDRRSWRRAKRRLRRKLRRPYGMKDGEWAYSYIVPRVFAEEWMEGPIVDYKFHCCDGRICWVQIISERSSGRPREANVDENHAALGLHLDGEFICDTAPPEKPVSWSEMCEVARLLSRGFKYVRVDLYQYRDKPSFGEMTFWPRAGKYATSDEGAFGELLDIDTTSRRPMIHDFFADAERRQSGALGGRLRRRMR